jgi:PhnB protein
MDFIERSSTMAKSNAEGMQSITPHLVVRGAAGAIDFYKRAFGAEERVRMDDPSGKVMHAELQIGNSRLMVADEYPGMGNPAPGKEGSPVVLNLYSDDVDALWKRATDAGAAVTMPLEDQFWGDRYGQVRDPFGHAWALGQHKEDVSPEEMRRRAKAAFAQMKQG